MTLRTSGTSGAARHVVRTTASWTSSFGHVSRLTGLTAASRVWVPGPRSATMNLFAAVHATVIGAGLVEGPDDATHAHLTPSTLARLLDEGVPLTGLTLVVAGDRLSPGLHDRAVAAGTRAHHYYGAAELSFVAWGRHAEDLRPFPGVEVLVRSGEIWVRSPYVCIGYDGPLGARRRDTDGWATVGDLGGLDGGRLTVSGRPAAVTVGGSTVEVSDVEGVLRTHATGEVVVVGVPHQTLGHVLAAVLTVLSDHGPLVDEGRSRLEGADRPRLWFHVERLPTTTAGKVDREALVSLLSTTGPGKRRLV